VAEIEDIVQLTGPRAPVTTRVGHTIRGVDPVAAVCALFIVAITLVALFAPLLAPDNPNTVDILARYQGPSAQHLLGTDSLGRDLLSRLIYGSRLSLLGPFLIIVIATVSGTFLAIVSAWVGGLFDNVVSRILDILFAFPGLILAMLAVALFGAGLIAPVIALSLAYLPYIARVLRSGAIRERTLPYIDACYAEGLPTRTIAARHLLPNIMPLVLVQATLSFGYALVDLAAISYLGLGVQPPSAEWGLMVANGQSSILSGHPQESIYAGLMIVLTVVAFNLLGDRLAVYFSTDRR
jgi:peptide/nickel transport system permease protein